jgi:hypothetical protein
MPLSLHSYKCPYCLESLLLPGNDLQKGTEGIRVKPDEVMVRLEELHCETILLLPATYPSTGKIRRFALDLFTPTRVSLTLSLR